MRPLGRRFPVCVGHDVRYTAAVRTAEGWRWYCPGEDGAHLAPMRRHSPPDAFPGCPVCGEVPKGLRPALREFKEKELPFLSVTLVGCGHVLGLPWPAAIGLV